MPNRPRVTALIIGSAQLVQMLEINTVVTALPAMGVAFGRDALSMSLIMTAYLTTLTAFIPLGGWLVDRFGARTVFLSAIALFVLSSVACALSESFHALVFARLVQGAAGALLAPVGLILLLRTVSQPQLLDAMAYIAIPSLIAPVIGPAVGGFMVVHASWQWIFLLNVPIGLVSFVIAVVTIPPDRERKRAPLDFRGFLLLGAALGCLMSVQALLSSSGSSPIAIPALLAISAGSAALYVAHARKTPHPIVDFSPLGVATYARSLIGGNLCRLSLGAFPFLLTLFLQLGLGLNALDAGLISLATALGSLAVRFVVGPWVRRFGFRHILVASGMLAGALTGSFAFLGTSAASSMIMVLLFALGFVRSLQLTASNALAYADIPAPSVATASSLAYMTQCLALTLGMGLAALCVQLSTLLREATHSTGTDIAVGFAISGIFCALSCLPFARLPRSAGSRLLAGATP